MQPHFGTLRFRRWEPSTASEADLGQRGFEAVSSLTRRYMTLETIDEVCKDQTVDVAKIATV